MMYTGWLSLGGTEIINTSRTVQYANQFGIPIGCADDCPDLASVLGDAPYSTGYNVPWDDPTQPTGFLGFRGLNITGMSNGVIRNVVTDLPGDGSFVGPGRRGRRELLIQVMGVATSNTALDYGIAWLNSVLRGAVCDDMGFCAGSTLCFYDQCPSCIDETPDECNQAHLKNLFQVGVLEPPVVVNRRSFGGTCAASGEAAAWAVLEFTLVAGIPYIYSQPQLIGETDAWVPNQGWFPDSVPGCPDPVDCSIDPDCPTPSVPPVVPVPIAECLEHLPGLYDTQWMAVDGGDLSDWFEKVPYITAFSGATAMKSLAIRFALNPTGATCSTTNMGGCLVCSTVFIPYLPANSTLVIDGRTERATITCNASAGLTVSGVTYTDETIVYGDEGEMYSWPEFECGEDMCVQVQASADWRADDAVVSVSMVERRDIA